MKTGYIEPYQTTESRSQVIVIVFDDWSVICYDSYLRILWKKLIINTMKHPPLELLLNHYHIDEVSLYIAPLQIKSTTTTTSSSSLTTEENESSSSSEQNSGMIMMNHGVVIIGANMIKRKVADISHLFIPDQLKFHILDAINNDFNVLNYTKIKSDSDNKEEYKDIEEKLYSKLQHYNVYTLNGLNGEILWKHNGEEIKVEQYSKSLPQHAYQLNIGSKNLQMKTHHSIGINDWTIFRRSFIDELPHSWYSNEYTGMRIAHFVRRHIGASAALYSHHHHHKNSNGNNKNYRYRLQKQKEQLELQQNLARNNDNSNNNNNNNNGKGKNGKSSSTKTKYTTTNNNFHPLLNGEIKLHGLEETAELPHNAAEHTENPNVVVIHKKNGLEIIALRTGVPITSLSLLTNRVYADVDGDNVIDAIVVLNNPKRVNIHNIEYHTHQYSSMNNYKLQHCMLIVMSGLPAQSQLFNGSICSNRLSIHDPLFSSYEEENQHHPQHQHHQHHKNTQKNNNINNNNEDNYGKILEQPYLQEDADYPSIMHTTPLILHKLNPKTKKESKIRDIIVYTHVGIVTSYSGDGTFNWQIRHAPKWSLQHKHHHHDSESDGNSVDNGNLDDVTKNNNNDHDDDDLYPIEAAAVAFDHDALRANNLGYHNNIFSHILLAGMIILMMIYN